jgi:hypothetical protein
MWPWQARALLPLLMRRVDRAGILDMGRHGPKGLASVVKLPVEVVEAGLSALLEDGCVQIRDSVLVIQNFLRAQECRQSDKARKVAQRERDRVEALSDVTKRDVQSQNVTESHQPSHAVTAGHTASHAVTLSYAELSTTEHNKEESCPRPAAPARDGRADEVWAFYVETLKRHRPKRRPGALSQKDRKRIVDLLKSGRSLDDLKAAVRGLFMSSWHMGIDERTGGREYLALEYALRKPEDMAAIADAAEDVKPVSAKPEPREALVDPRLIEEWEARMFGPDDDKGAA